MPPHASPADAVKIVSCRYPASSKMSKFARMKMSATKEKEKDKPKTVEVAEADEPADSKLPPTTAADGM